MVDKPGQTIEDFFEGQELAKLPPDAVTKNRQSLESLRNEQLKIYIKKAASIEQQLDNIKDNKDINPKKFETTIQQAKRLTKAIKDNPHGKFSQVLYYDSLEKFDKNLDKLQDKIDSFPYKVKNLENTLPDDSTEIKFKNIQIVPKDDSSELDQITESDSDSDLYRRETEDLGINEFKNQQLEVDQELPVFPPHIDSYPIPSNGNIGIEMPLPPSPFSKDDNSGSESTVNQPRWKRIISAVKNRFLPTKQNSLNVIPRQVPTPDNIPLPPEGDPTHIPDPSKLPPKVNS